MADMNHLGQRQRVRGWHPTRVPQPSQIRDDHPAQFKKQTEKDIKYPRNATTPNTTTTIPTSSTHDDEQQPPPIITHVSPPTCPAWRPTTRRYRTIRMKHAESPSQTIDDLHAHYQKILTKSDSKRLRNTTTTTITTSPTRDDEQHPLKMTHVNLPARPARTPTTCRYRTIRIMKRAENPDQTIDDLHAHYQKILTESDSNKRLRNTTPTTITTSPKRYEDLQARVAKSKDNNETYTTVQEPIIGAHHATVLVHNHHIRPLEIAISHSSITTKTQTTHSPTFRPTEDIIKTKSLTTITQPSMFKSTEELGPLTHAKITNATHTTSHRHTTQGNLPNKETHGTQYSGQHKVPPHRKQRPKTKPLRAWKKE